MVYCKVTSPYLSSAHPAEGDDSSEGIEISMHLEATSGGAETSVGLAQVQSQISNITMQLKYMAKRKVMHENV
jgi:hypothetical protein